MRVGKKFFLILVSLFLLSGVIVGCEEKAAGPVKQHLNYLLPDVPLSLDPANLQDEAGYQVLTNLFEGLVRLQPDGTLEKAMAEDWQVTAEGKKYIFTLRDAVWSDGEKVTADDFVRAIKRNLDPSLNCPYAYLLYDLKNAEGYHRSLKPDYYGKKFKEEQVGIWAENEKTLVMELEKREPAFIKKLIHPVFYPLPAEAFLTEEFFAVPGLVGNGPFKILGEDGEKYTLVKNEKYWDREAVTLESMDWYLPSPEKTYQQYYAENKVDLTVDIPFAKVEEGLKKGYLKSTPLLSTYFYQINVMKKPLADRRVRQALSFALKREELVEKFLRGGQKPAQGLIPAGMPDRAPGTGFGQMRKKKLPNHNVKEAQRLLAEAGYHAGENFPQLELLVSDTGGHQYLAEKVQAQWQENLGITVKVTSLPWQELVRRMARRDYDLGLLGWGADYIDPSVFLKHYVSGSGNNDTGWSNPEYDRLLKEAGASEVEETRMVALHQAEEILLEELPVLPLYEYGKVYAVREKVKGLLFSPLGQGIDFKWTQISKKG